MTIAIATGIVGLMLGASLGVLVGAALGARRREELERTLAWLERMQRARAADASPRHPADDLLAQVRLLAPVRRVAPARRPASAASR
jgi:hypothetical protein